MKLIALTLFASANLGSFAASAASSSGLLQKRTPTLKGQASKADSIVRKLAPGDWTLTHDKSGSSADFTQKETGDDGSGIVTSNWNYSVGEGGSFYAFLRAGGCGSSATEANLKPTVVGPATCYSTPCVYNFDKGTDMTAANGYNAATGELKLCEIASLTLNNGMKINEVYMDITVGFTLTGNFEVSSVSMSPATILENTETTSLADYITAANCGASPLPPNTPLCIQISSSSSDVLIESLDTMSITGNTAAGGSLAVVSSSNTASYPAITSIDGVDTTDVTVTTRVPTNTFNFEVTDAAITVTGSVTVKFAGRRLTVDVDRLLQAANNEETASFDVNVQLASEPELALEGGEEVMMNSANAAAGKAFAILGMVFASAFALF